MSTLATAPTEQRFRLSGVDWAAYASVGRLFAERPIRLTYDRGELELMTTSREHERSKHLLALMVGALCEEMNIDIDGAGSMTFQREDLDRGFESDECWRVQHEAQVRGRDELDWETDPPPDLVLEVEVTR